MLDRRAFLGRSLVLAGGIGGLGRAKAAPVGGAPSCSPASHPWQKQGIVFGSEIEGGVQNFTCAAEPLPSDQIGRAHV
jgi:hypothetical protein